MATTIQEVTSSDDRIEAEREIIKQALAEIAKEVGSRLQEATLNYPIYLTVPNSGQALMQLGTQLDPSDEDWNKITKIAQEILSGKLGGVRLGNRNMVCATADAAMNVANMITE